MSFVVAGIIDILQSFGMTKRLEHSLKSLFHDGDTVSVHRPSFYAARFKKFMVRRKNALTTSRKCRRFDWRNVVIKYFVATVPYFKDIFKGSIWVILFLYEKGSDMGKNQDPR